MKYLKLFESVNKPYQVGDYLIILTFDESNDYHIAKLTEIKGNELRIMKGDDKERIYTVLPHMVKFWSDNKEELEEELEIILNTKKYNI